MIQPWDLEEKSMIQPAPSSLKKATMIQTAPSRLKKAWSQKAATIQTAPSSKILDCSIPSQKRMVRKNRLEKSRWGLEETLFQMVFF